MWPLHVPGHEMSLCEMIQAQSKDMKSTWSTVHSGRAGRVRFRGAKKCPAEGQELSSIMTNAIKEVLKENKLSKIWLNTNLAWRKSRKFLTSKTSASGRNKTMPEESGECSGSAKERHGGETRIRLDKSCSESNKRKKIVITHLCHWFI